MTLTLTDLFCGADGTAAMNHELRNRADRLRQLFAAHPEAVACRHCGSPIRPLRHGVRMWEHITTRLPRCVAGDYPAALAAPAENQMSLLADLKEVA
ncbi:hypothetical protein [Saccharopolyspora thermophila]|uniref:C2H2-type domain-containing protein n=1 Tax=Saccharopolyspora thermophila TaxID=89367 RepID=A0ABN1C124_9PSEU